MYQSARLALLNNQVAPPYVNPREKIARRNFFLFDLV